MMKSKTNESLKMPECVVEALAKIRAAHKMYNRQYLKRQLVNNEALNTDLKPLKQPPEICQSSQPVQLPEIKDSSESGSPPEIKNSSELVSPTEIKNSSESFPREIEWKDLIAAIDREMARIGWSEKDGINYLQNRYGKRSRLLLSDEEILDFYNYLKAQPDSTHPEYVLVEDLEQLEKAIANLNSARVIGIDTETTGLDPHKASLRLIQLAAENQLTILIDCFKVKDLAPLQPLLESKVVKVGHNLKFDLKFLLNSGLNLLPPFFDTQIASQLLKAGIEGKHSLQAIAKEYLEISLDKTEQIGEWKAETISESQLSYAAEDARILLSLRDKLKPLLIESGLVKVAKIEFDCLKAVAEIEFNGMLLDLAQWELVKEEMIAKKDAAAEKLRGMLEVENHQLAIFEDINTINLNSNPQVLQALNRLGIPVTSTGKKEIAPLASKYPAIDALLEYRQWAKALSAFGESLPKHINPVTGRLHPDYWQMGSAAGRFSCSNPNLQQIPRTKEVRECFTAHPGYKLVIADYSQIELRIAAEIAGEAAMIEAYRNGKDLHRLTASLILDKPVEEVTKADRQIAKSANFGLLYGMGAEGFKKYAESNYGVSFTLKEAEANRNKFFKAYQGLARWHKQTKKQMYQDKNARVNIETRTLANRRRLMPQPSPQQILNTPVQGTGADMLKLALSRLPEALKGTDARIIGIVHDEIILECPEPTAAIAAERISAVMVQAGKEFLVSIPVEAEASIGDSWADKN
ncbi:MAG: bifunctional 3'-5' exonuclease/DNA polymerase [Prochloraceae cyanobacterium]|nr:bifunctional 3'-5' exonuclease/DNA polymerase [Prochloraceae cyanobacterium]